MQRRNIGEIFGSSAGPSLSTTFLVSKQFKPTILSKRFDLISSNGNFSI